MQLIKHNSIARLHSRFLNQGANFLILCLLIFTVSTLYAQETPDIKEAFRYIEIEQPTRAREVLERISAFEKKKPNDQYYLGLGYLKLGDLEKAAKAFDEGISLKEKYGLNYAGKGHLKMLQQEKAAGASLLQKALKLGRDKDAEILTAVAAAYLTDSVDVSTAIGLLTKAKSIDNDNQLTHLLLGDAQLMLNNGGEAVSSYERAASSDAEWATPHYNIARVFERSKNYNMVFESLNRAIAVDSLFGPAYRKLGEMYYVRREADKAVNAYEKYLSITESPGDAQYQYAFFLIMAKQFDKANAIFEKVIHSENVPAIALKYYAFSLLEQDTARQNAEKARPLLERYMTKLRPEEIDATDYAYHGKLLLKLNEDSLASVSFARSIELDSAQQDILKIHGGNLLRNRRFAEAAEAYKKLLQLDESPSLQDLWYMGQAYYFDEQYVNADSTFNMILDKQVIEKLPFQVILFSARSKANIDSTMTTGLAKPMYEALLERVSKDLSKLEEEAIEAYTYLGAFYIHKEENVAKAKTYYEKILQLDANNSTAKEFMQTINGDKQQKGG